MSVPDKCPKCGCTRIAGPTYRKPSGWRNDALVYRCERCCYVIETPCNDAKQPEDGDE